MSRTIRRPPPRRRLRAGYVKRLCWRCRGRVCDCSCPARDIVQAPSIEDPKLVAEEFIAAVLPEWRVFDSRIDCGCYSCDSTGDRY